MDGDAANGDAANGHTINGDAVNEEATNGDAQGMLLRRNMLLTGKVEGNTIQAWILNE